MLVPLKVSFLRARAAFRFCRKAEPLDKRGEDPMVVELDAAVAGSDTEVADTRNVDVLQPIKFPVLGVGVIIELNRLSIPK